MNNYFKVGGRKLVCFDDTNLEQVAEAYKIALELSATLGKLSLWKMPKFAGPWKQIDLVGFRDERSIRSDITDLTKELSVPQNSYSRGMYETWLRERQAELEARLSAVGTLELAS